MLFVIGVKHQRFGIAAGLMMSIIALTSRLLIRRFYELFYMMHVLFVIAILITLYFHRPWIKTRTSVVVIICAGLFVLDKVTPHCQVRHIQPWNHGNGCTPCKWKHPHHFEPESAPAPRQDRMLSSGSLVSKPYSTIIAR
jgi:hypothetical protein